jgi:cysteine desulfurase
VDSEAVILAWKSLAAVSNGSACTSHDYTPSHVLLAMGLNPAQVDGALRLSWSHLTPEPDWSAMAQAIRSLT